MPWSNSAADNYVLLLRNGIQTAVPGVQSETAEDVQLFNGKNYRDEMNASFIGAGRTLAGIAGGTSAVLVTNGDQHNVTVAGGTWSFSTPSDPHIEESDSFTHTPPRPEEITRTRFLWWSGATGTGNVVAWAWADQVIDMSPSDHIRI